jgi:hypothetical protein
MSKVSDVLAKWIEYRIEDIDTKKYIHHRGISGTSQQRRVALRALIRKHNKGRNLTVSKHTWVKGEMAASAKVEWTKNYPAI